MENEPVNAIPASPSPEEPDISETQPVSLDQTQPHQPTPDTPGPQDITQAVPVSQLDVKSDAAQPISASAGDVDSAAGEVVSAGTGGQGGAGEPLGGETPPKRRSLRWILYVVLGLLLLVSIAVVSGIGGYQSAIDLRRGYKQTQVSEETQHQFDLGMQDLQDGRLDLARQRFEYIIQLDPNYPGITEVLAEVLLKINTTATPTIAPTPTLSPTPDLRSQEELYLQAREHMAGADWTAAIDTLLTLRKRFPEYMTVEVDGLLYIALRNRGVQKISIQADLEGGTYDLTLAEGFGPLDVEARNWRDWAVLYTRGASFWDVDWQQAVYYFSQLAQIAPNLMDASRLTSFERYALALIGYGDWLAQQEMWCDAQEQYQLSLNLRGSPEVEPTASYVAEKCSNPEPSGGSGSGVVTLTPTLTPTPGGEASPTSPPPAVTPTATTPAPAATSTATTPPPSATPTPSATTDGQG